MTYHKNLYSEPTLDSQLKNIYKYLNGQHPMAKNILKQNEMCTVYLFDMQDLKFICLIIVLSKPKLMLNLTYIIRRIACEST